MPPGWLLNQARRIWAPRPLTTGWRGWIGCCAKGCVYFSDDFTRSTIGLNWIVDSGFWSILAGKLSTTSANARLRCAKQNPIEDEHVVSVFASSTASGDQVRVFTNFLSSTDYWFAELEFGATDSTLRIWENTGGGDVQRGSDANVEGVAAGDTAVIRICFGASAIRVEVRENVGAPGFLLKGAINFATADIGDSICACATGTLTGTATFDTWKLEHHGENRGGCPTCLNCTICGVSPPVSYDITVPSMFGGDVLTGCSSAECNAALAGSFTLDHFAGCTHIFESADDAICTGPDHGFQYRGTYLTSAATGVDLVQLQLFTKRSGVLRPLPTATWVSTTNPFVCEDDTILRFNGGRILGCSPAVPPFDPAGNVDYEPN